MIGNYVHENEIGPLGLGFRHSISPIRGLGKLVTGPGVSTNLILA
jgi:hypothetical protein